MAVLKIKDALGNVQEIPAIQGIGVKRSFVEADGDEYRLKLVLTDDTIVDAGPLPASTAVEEHTHGSLSFEGKVGTEAGRIVETDTGGFIKAGRKIVIGETAPEDVTGLEDGDIYLYIGE